MERLFKKLGLKGFWVAERHFESGYHTHAVASSNLPPKAIKTAFEKMTKGGRSEVMPCDERNGGATKYITKSLWKDGTDHDFHF